MQLLLLAIGVIMGGAIPASQICARKYGSRMKAVPLTGKHSAKGKRQAADADSIDASLKFYAFRKSARATRESFMIVNEGPDPVGAIDLQITYYDLNDRMLHRRIVTVKETIPPVEARQVSIRSWDHSGTYYFHADTPPKRKATPFKVAFKIIKLYSPE